MKGFPETRGANTGPCHYPDKYTINVYTYRLKVYLPGQ